LSLTYRTWRNLFLFTDHSQTKSNTIEKSTSITPFGYHVQFYKVQEEEEEEEEEEGYFKFTQVSQCGPLRYFIILVTLESCSICMYVKGLKCGPFLSVIVLTYPSDILVVFFFIFNHYHESVRLPYAFHCCSLIGFHCRPVMLANLSKLNAPLRYTQLWYHGTCVPLGYRIGLSAKTQLLICLFRIIIHELDSVIACQSHQCKSIWQKESSMIWHVILWEGGGIIRSITLRLCCRQRLINYWVRLTVLHVDVFPVI